MGGGSTQGAAGGRPSSCVGRGSTCCYKVCCEAHARGRAALDVGIGAGAAGRGSRRRAEAAGGRLGGCSIQRGPAQRGPSNARTAQHTALQMTTHNNTQLQHATTTKHHTSTYTQTTTHLHTYITNNTYLQTVRQQVQHMRPDPRRAPLLVQPGQLGRQELRAGGLEL